MSKKKTNEEFVIGANLVHKNYFDYSLSDYKGNNIKVKIICPKHGMFEQTPVNHINKKQGCPFCAGNKKSNTKDFIIKSKKKHKVEDYDYSLVNYENAFKKVKIICKKHGVFEQTPNNHLKGEKCPNCSNNKKKDTKDFIDISSKKHNNFFDYSLSNYTTTNNKIKIICPEHGVFEQRAYNHMSGIGCPFCNESKGEKLIVSYLNKRNINFTRQKKFEGCKNKRLLPFDFYLPEYNLCIEYDGKQHFQSIDYFGGHNNYIYIKNNDNIKNKYCEENNINLIRIKYTDIKKINKILNGII